MRDVQCYELFGGIAPKNNAFSFSVIDGLPYMIDISEFVPSNVMSITPLLRYCWLVIDETIESS